MYFGEERQVRRFYGQLDAITAVLNGQWALVVQKTGWSKSLIYFLSTKILREEVVISPLLALINNQIESANTFGLPTYKEMDIIVKTIENSNGLTLYGITKEIDISYGRLENCLKFLMINGDIYKDSSKYNKSPKPWMPDLVRSFAERLSKALALPYYDSII